MNFETFLLLVTVLYLVQALIVIAGVRRVRDSDAGARPFVTVIVAARNEEALIDGCMRSLCAQTYPSDRFEVILADDGSTDGTVSKATEAMGGATNFAVVPVKEEAGLRGKSNALAQAIDKARGEVILITDADCIVPPTWVERTAARFAPEVGLVGGITLPVGRRIFDGVQTLDWAYILGLAAAGAALRYPLGSIGNNLAFRKKAYEDVGGYRGLKFSVTEDYTLVQAIIRTKKWKYVFPIDPSSIVRTLPCPSIGSALRQKKRWGRGGLDMRIGGLALMVVSFAMHLSPFIMLAWNGVVIATLTLFAKSVFDYIFLHTILQRAGMTDSLRRFWWFELYFVFYVLALPFLVFFGGKVHWKGRVF